MNKKQWNKLLLKVAQQIHAGESVGIIDVDMVKLHSLELMKAIESGFGATLQDTDLSEKNKEVLTSLQQNVYHFSGAKNWQQIQEMSAMLKDSNGELLSFNKFLQAVQQVDKTYNQTYLQAEYQNAVTSAQMAEKWQQFQLQIDVLPNLRWETAAGEHTCELCSSLNDITLPVNHSFWKTTFVPRHFKCKCNIVQEDEFVELTDISKRKIPDTHPMFRTNTGISGVAFSDKHPYFTSMPEDVKKKVFIASESIIDKP